MYVRGIAFIEYKTLQCCAEAINSMNLFDLGGQFIRVGRVSRHVADSYVLE